MREGLVDARGGGAQGALKCVGVAVAVDERSAEHWGVHEVSLGDACPETLLEVSKPEESPGVGQLSSQRLETPRPRSRSREEDDRAWLRLLEDSLEVAAAVERGVVRHPLRDGPVAAAHARMDDFHVKRLSGAVVFKFERTVAHQHSFTATANRRAGTVDRDPELWLPERTDERFACSTLKRHQEVGDDQVMSQASRVRHAAASPALRVATLVQEAPAKPSERVQGPSAGGSAVTYASDEPLEEVTVEVSVGPQKTKPALGDALTRASKRESAQVGSGQVPVPCHVSDRLDVARSELNCRRRNGADEL